MNNIKAIFCKQFKSMIKSPGMLLQGGAFLLIALVMTFLIGMDEERDCDACITAYVCAECMEANPALDTPNPSIFGLFAVLFIGMAMIGSASALVAEDKSTQNLRFITMANVKPKEYLIGTVASMMLLSFGVLVLYALAGRYWGMEMVWFVAVMWSASLVSIIFGLTIGLSKSPALAFPVSMVLGMGPMLSSFNENLARYLRFTYTQQANMAASDLNQGLSMDFTSNFIIIGINGIVVLAAFIWIHRKGSLRY